MKLRRQSSEPAPIILSSRRVSVFEITPALMSPTVSRCHGDQFRCAYYVDTPVLTIIEPKDFLRGHEPVLDDPVERAADQLGRALRAHARRNAQLAANGTKRNPSLKRVEVATSEGDLCQVEFRHG
jgi:hypothetical protein